LQCAPNLYYYHGLRNAINDNIVIFYHNNENVLWITSVVLRDRCNVRKTCHRMTPDRRWTSCIVCRIHTCTCQISVRTARRRRMVWPRTDAGSWLRLLQTKLRGRFATVYHWRSPASIQIRNYYKLLQQWKRCHDLQAGERLLLL